MIPVELAHGRDGPGLLTQHATARCRAAGRQIRRSLQPTFTAPSPTIRSRDNDGLHTRVGMTGLDRLEQLGEHWSA